MAHCRHCIKRLHGRFVVKRWHTMPSSCNNKKWPYWCTCSLPSQVLIIATLPRVTGMPTQWPTKDLPALRASLSSWSLVSLSMRLIGSASVLPYTTISRRPRMALDIVSQVLLYIGAPPAKASLHGIFSPPSRHRWANRSTNAGDPMMIRVRCLRHRSRTGSGSNLRISLCRMPVAPV